MKINTKALTGMMELLPQEQIEFDRILGVIKKHYEAFGFSPIDTPIIERTETLLAKAGGETEKQIYSFERGKHNLSLRFDLTVPTARYIAEHASELVFPFKRYQIGKVYRGERAQKGRYREFYQCDIDIIGRDNLSVRYDAEVIAVIYSIFKELNLGKFILRISNRSLASGLIQSLGVEKNESDILSLIDKKEKISDDEFDEILEDISLGESVNQQIKSFINISELDNDAAFSALDKMSKELSNSTFDRGLNELKGVFEMLNAICVNPEYVKVDALIVRGLDYYTGTIFETNLIEHKNFGSIASGGRYDDLSQYYSKEKFPGVGASIGLTRLFSCLKEYDLLDFSKKSKVEMLIIPYSRAELAKSLDIARKLRNEQINTEVILDDISMKKAFKIADKRGVDFVMVVGEAEIKNDKFYCKNMHTGEEISLEDYIADRGNR